MAIQLQNEQQIEQHEQGSSLLLDALYCEEERWVEEEEVLQGESESETYGSQNNDVNKPSLFPLHLSEQDLFWEDEELLSLFSKEQKQAHLDYSIVETDSGTISVARREAVEWMLKVHVYYGFSIPTAILAINYLDRFLTSLHIQRDKPCMIQLVAVACLSLAAKVEETQVPLLLDLQVEGAKYVFEAKIIQRMELLVLATLQWKMQPVTPLSFIDHVIRRVGLKTHLHVDFLRRCERLLLSVVSGSRFVGYLPSVLATATMMHVIYQVEPCNHIEYENQLLGVLEISKEKVNDCYNLIAELSKADNCDHYNLHKRKYEQIPCSPNGVFDAVFSSDGSNDSWAVGSSVYSSLEPLFKKSRANEQQLKFSPFSRVSVGIVGSSP